MQKLNYRFTLRRDQPAKDGSCKLVLVCTINGDRLRMSVGMSVHPNNFDEVKMQMRSKGDLDHAKQVNTYLLKIRRKVDEIFFDHLNTDTILTVKKFEEAFSRKAASGDFLTFMQNEMDAAKDSQAPGTIKAWNSTYNHLRACFTKIPYADICLDLVKKFDSYLKKKKFESAYIAKNHSFLRKYILLANKKGKKVPNPYTEFKVVIQQKEREFLNAKEVQGLRELYNKKELPAHLQRALRHFLFQIGTSLRYSDLAAMTKENVINNMLVFCPIKTQKHGKLVKCPLSDMAKSMLNDSESVTDKLFSVYAEQTMNRWLKDIAAFAGISKKLTTHLGRHSYGYLFIAAGGQVEVLQKIMGHSDIKTTMIYTHIDTRQITEGVDRINSFLSVVAE
jgi:site-specific recombinase XerD